MYDLIRVSLRAPLTQENSRAWINDVRWTLEPSSITLNTNEPVGRVLRLSGHVTGDYVAGFSVTFSGAIQGNASLDEHGNFSYSTESNALGSRYVIEIDPTQLSLNGDQTKSTIDVDSPSSQTDIGKFLPSDLTEAEKAVSLRVIWMRRMGLDEGEIADSLRSDPPSSVEQEMMELVALERLKARPSSEILEKIAIKY